MVAIWWLAHIGSREELGVHRLATGSQIRCPVTPRSCSQGKSRGPGCWSRAGRLQPPEQLFAPFISEQPGAFRAQL